MSEGTRTLPTGPNLEKVLAFRDAEIDLEMARTDLDTKRANRGAIEGNQTTYLMSMSQPEYQKMLQLAIHDERDAELIRDLKINALERARLHLNH